MLTFKSMCKNVLLLSFFLIIGASNRNNEPPKTVYRMDTRPPEVIFENGFENWGDETSLFEHVEGISMGLTDGTGSAYVSTTSDLNYALNFARAVRPNVFYIYEIRASNNFYSIYESFNEYANIEAGYYAIRDNFESSNEYVAYRGIPNQQIIRATEYTMNGDNVSSVRSLENNNYYHEDTHANASAAPDGFAPLDRDDDYTEIYHCANETYSNRNNRIRYFFEKMMYCYNESKLYSAPSIISASPGQSYGQTGSDSFSGIATVTFEINDFQKTYPAINMYRVYYKLASDGDTWRNAKFINVKAYKELERYKVDLLLDTIENIGKVWAFTVVAIDYDGSIINNPPNGSKNSYPGDGDKTNNTYLISSKYSTSPDGWYPPQKEYTSDFTCPDGQAMIGRSHWGSEKEDTYYRCTFLFVNGKLTVYSPLQAKTRYLIDESEKSYFECPENTFIIGREHNKQKDSSVYYTCANFFYGTDMKRYVRYKRESNQNIIISDEFPEDSHQFSCGSALSKSDNEHSMPPPPNLALYSVKSSGGYNKKLQYGCAKLMDTEVDK